MPECGWNPKPLPGGDATAEMIEEYERLEALAEVARAEHPPDEAVLDPSLAQLDPTHGHFPNLETISSRLIFIAFRPSSVPKSVKS